MMKKFISILTLFMFTLHGNPSQLTKTHDGEASPIYAAPNPSLQKREQKPSNRWRATAAIIGTLAAITIGLFASGKNTGKEYQKSSEGQTAS